MAGLLDEIGVCPATLMVDPMQAGPDRFRTALEAASAAGDSALSLWAFQATSFGLDDTVSLADDLGLRVGAVEAALTWVDGPSPQMRAEGEALIDVARRLGAGLVMAVTMEPTIDGGAAAEGLAGSGRDGRRRRDAGRRGVPAVVGHPLARRRRRPRGGGGEPAAGIVLDCWHWQRQPGGPDLARLRSLPPDRIAYVQLCDAAPQAAAELYGEAMTARLLPGHGAVDLSALLGSLDEIGARPFVASEVFSTDLVALGPDVAARRIHDACAALR